MTTMDLLDDARWQMERVAGVVRGKLGWRAIDVECGLGVGLVVGFSDTDFVLLSVMGSSAHSVYLSAGVARQVEDDEFALLAICNKNTHENPSFPTFLQKSEAGWSILVQQSFPGQVLINSPDFIGTCIEALPQRADQIRDQLAERQTRGVPYKLNEADVNELLIRGFI